MISSHFCDIKALSSVLKVAARNFCHKSLDKNLELSGNSIHVHIIRMHTCIACTYVSLLLAMTTYGSILDQEYGEENIMEMTD